MLCGHGTANTTLPGPSCSSWLPPGADTFGDKSFMAKPKLRLIMVFISPTWAETSASSRCGTRTGAAPGERGMSPGGCHQGDVPRAQRDVPPAGCRARGRAPRPAAEARREGGRPGDISRRRGLPASFFARCITSRRCHTPSPLPAAHGEPARRGQPRLRRPPLLLQVSGTGGEPGPGAVPSSEPGEPWGQHSAWGQPQSLGTT